MSIVIQPRSRLVYIALLLLPIGTPAQETASLPRQWTLENSIERVLEIAPEWKAAEAAVAARQGALRQASAWPNPIIYVQASDKLGKDDGAGGRDITQYSFGQPLPLSGRLSHQKSIAREDLASVEAERRHWQLYLEQQTAERFRQLQLTTANFELAEQRLKLANEIQAASVRREEAGELSTLERLRLGLVREEAQQSMDLAEGRYNEALSQYRAYLGLTSGAVPVLAPLTPVGPVPPLAIFEASLTDQPLLVAAQHRIEGARANVRLSRASRWPDPILSVVREKDFLGGRRQEYTGVALSITVPLWDQKGGQISRSRAEVNQAESQLESLQRDITSRVQLNYLHLNHLVQQGEHYRTHVFEPAQQVLDLTNKAYFVGEVEVLSLIDANATYFNAHSRYLQLLQEAWLEMAELKLSAGQSVLQTEQGK